MHPRVGRHGKHGQVKGRRGLDQARARHAPLLGLALLVAGCSGGLPQDADPRYWWRNISGAYLNEREPPPGRDAPYPNLATVPARPVPPDAATRAAITAGLAADRLGARDPLTGVPLTGTQQPGGAGDQQPPAPPRLASMPPIRLDPLPAAATAPVVVAPPETAAPAAGPPAAPPAELLAPPRPALPDLSGPPAAPSSDLLAPRPN